ncbi:MAG: cytochrome c, partial [Acidobacteria bacterium]|nr:cytochrome c [Acidobacteriota bacterium]
MKRILAAVIPLLALAGCDGTTTRNTPIEIVPDMQRQGKYKPQEPGPFFADGRASRAPVPGTVA